MLKRTFVITIGLVSVLLAMQACSVKPDPQASCNFVQNSDVQRVSWGADVPVPLYIDSEFPVEKRGAVQAAADEWNTIAGHPLIKIVGVTNRGGGPAQDGFNIIYWMTSWDTAATNEQARTTIYWTGTRIYEADVRINARAGDHQYFWSNEPQPGELDVESLLVHEFGHVLGLVHTVTAGSVMVKALAVANATTDFTERRTPNGFDSSSIRCEY